MTVERSLDLICMGRAAVDLYGEQLGAPLEEVQTFAKYVGGCAANIAVGAAQQGLRVAMVTRVGDEAMGRFVRDALRAEGVDVQHVITDPQRLTALVLLSVRSRDQFPLIFYRERCADMAIALEDFDRDFIASAKALLVTGTHFSTDTAAEVSHQAIQWARAAGTRVVLDVDYRPMLWDIADPQVITESLQRLAPDCDLIVGTEEEMCVAGGVSDLLTALRHVRTLTAATLVVKRGPRGCVVFDGPIPATLEEGLVQEGLPVQVFNVLGAGDAFMSGFLRGWIAQTPLQNAALLGAACGALVVSRHGCAPAMPSREELDDYLSRRNKVPRLDLDARLQHLHRVTTRPRLWPELCVFAFDNRMLFTEWAADAQRSARDVEALKVLLARAAQDVHQQMGLHDKAGAIIDSQYGLDALDTLAGSDWWLARPIEVSGSTPLEFVGGPDVGLTLRTWPRAHAVKCLVRYHPDSTATLRAHQENRVRQLHYACIQTGHELLLEILPEPHLPHDDHTLARAVANVYGCGVAPDWWKLEAPRSAAAWTNLCEVIRSRDPHCRGVLLLGGGQDDVSLNRAYTLAREVPECKGFAVGRSIFAPWAKDWLNGRVRDDVLVTEVAKRFAAVLQLWRGPS